MAQLTTEQVAELLLGVARAQLAMADAVESAKAGFKETHLRTQVETAARIKMNRPVQLADLPSLLLLQMLGRNPPNSDEVAAELQRLMAENAAVESGVSLDMTR